MPSGRHEYNKSSMASWSWKESRLEKIFLSYYDSRESRLEKIVEENTPYVLDVATWHLHSTTSISLELTF